MGEEQGLYIISRTLALGAPLVQAAATSQVSPELQLHLSSYLDSPHSANRAKQGSSVSKLFIGARAWEFMGEPDMSVDALAIIRVTE